MRTRASMLNAFSAVLMQVYLIFLNIISRRILFYALGTEYVGLSSLFSGILDMLNLAELGLGTAIAYHLYHAFAIHSEEDAGKLISFFTKSYTYIAGFIFIAGISITPLIGKLMKEVPEIPWISLIYILHLCDTAASYLLSAKRLVLQADQKSYYLSFSRIMQQTVSLIFSVFILKLTRNYMLYLLMRIGVHVAENVFIVCCVNKRYPYLKKYKNSKLKDEEKKELAASVQAVVWVKIGDYFSTSIDIILVSKLCGVAATAVYSNAMLIITSVRGLMNQMFQAVTASFANLMTSEREKSYEIFKVIYFTNFWVSSVCSICLFYLLNPFILLWLGKEYCVAESTVMILCFNFYILSMRNSANIPRQAGGLYIYDRYASVAEAVINLVSSTILGMKFGLDGILLGTSITALSVQFLTVPYNVYRRLFKVKILNYYKRFIFYMIKMAIAGLFVGMLLQYAVSDNMLITFILSGCICFFGTNICLFFLTMGNKERRYLFSMITSVCKKR